METFAFFENKSPEISEFPEIRLFMRVLLDKKAEVHRLHRNDGIEIHYIHSGRYAFRVEGVDCHLSPGDAIVTCPWMPHHAVDHHLPLGSFDVLLLKPRCFTQADNLDLGSWSQLPAELQLACGQRLASAQRPIILRAQEIAALFEQLARELHQQNNEPLSDLADLAHNWSIHALLDRIIVSSARNVALEFVAESVVEPAAKTVTEDTPLETESKLVPVRNAVAENLARSWTVVQLAELIAVSPSQLTRLMKKEIGLSPTQYILAERLAWARQALDETAASIAEIAVSSGFANGQHFANAFKRATGISPKEWKTRRRPEDQTDIPEGA